MNKTDDEIIDIYRFNFYDTVLKNIDNVVNIDFSLENRTLQDIKKILGNSKKKAKKVNNFLKKITHLKFSYINCFRCVFPLFYCQT